MTITNTSILKKLLLLLLVFTGIYFSKAFLMPLLFAGILATLFLPLCNWLEKKRLPKSMAVLVCFLSLTAFFSGLIMLVSWKISELINDVALIKQTAIETVYNAADIGFENISVDLIFNLPKQTKD